MPRAETEEAAQARTKCALSASEFAHLAAQALGLTFQSVHRLIGIVVYLAGLLILCLTLQIWLSSRGALLRGPAALVALGCYAAVTLLVPLLAGIWLRNRSERPWVWPRHFGSAGSALVLVMSPKPPQ